MEFDTHEDAYLFYKDYAKSIGFGTAKLSSRRSRASKEFIDAKFSCIRYGSKQQSDEAINPRASPKIGCKASMHVKRRPDNKWYVYSFVKEHNHELLPEQSHFFRSHRTNNNNNTTETVKRKKNNNPISDCKHLSAYHDLSFLDNHIRNQNDKGRRLALGDNEAQVLLEFLMVMQEENPKFFYALDFNEEHVLRNVFWVDSKGVEDYKSFNDVVSLDTSYVVSKYKVPLVVFFGVNHHEQPLLLGCGLIADETVYTYVWLLQTWLLAMNGSNSKPRVILTDQSNAVKAAVASVLPETRHCYCLWHVLDKLPKNLDYWSMWEDTFMKKLFKCIYKSWSEEEFDKRWLKLIEKFHLRDVQWIRSLYEERRSWAPTFMRGVTFSGLSTRYRSESLNSLFDKYLQCETTLKDFLERYGLMLEDMYEEEAKADFDAWHETPELKSPSPFEKQMLLVYTHEIFKKFQAEVLGAAACHLTKEEGTTYSVKDFEDDQRYLVDWDETSSDIYCSCRLFEYRGYLCRHAIVVLQMNGVFTIPSNYVLQRWTNAARNRHRIDGNVEVVQCNIRRFNDLCRRAVILGEEGSLSQESYDVAMVAMKEAFKQCAIKSNTIEDQFGSTSKLIEPELNIHVDNGLGQADIIREKKSSLNKKAKHVTQSRIVGEGSQEGFQQMAAPRPLQAVMAGQYHNTMQGVFQNVIPAEFHNMQATNMHQNNHPPG